MELHRNVIFYSEQNSQNKVVFNNVWQKIFIRVYSIIRKIHFLKLLFHKSYNLPLDTIITSGFQCDSPNLHLGNNVILGSHLHVICAYAPIFIGENTMLSHYNTIITSTHDIKNRSIIIGKPVIIGRNVWITSNVTILAGVKIGDNSIIGAGSIVTKDIPENVFAAGNPCRVIKEL